MSTNAPLLPFLAFLCARNGDHESVVVDGRYLAGRHVVLLPRFAMAGEQEHADAIGLEYGQTVEFRGDLVIGTTEQLERLRAHFESYRAEEANDPEAVEFWQSLIAPLSAEGTAPKIEPHPAFVEGWYAWYSRREQFGLLPLR